MKKRFKFNITLEDVKRFNPCFDPTTVTHKKRGTLLDVLALDNVKPVDRIWLVSRFLDDRTARLFAVWCAREALKLDKSPDPRSIEACRVAERFAKGRATEEERIAARDAANNARREKWAAAAHAAYAAAYAAAAAADAYAAFAADAAADAYAAAAAFAAASREQFLQSAVRQLTKMVKARRARK